jgi:hypothetical protein
MLIVQEMWKKSLINFNITMGLLMCVLINYGNCKMQLLNNGLNILKFNGSTHVSCW